MPRSAVAAFIATAVIILVLLFGMGAFDVDARETRFVAGACDIPEQNVATVVSLTTGDDIDDGNFDTFHSPDTTVHFAVPARHELRICLLIVHGKAGGVNKHLHMGYGDDAVSNVAGAPTNDVIVNHIPVSGLATGEHNQVITFLFNPIPAGKFPFIQLSPGESWEAAGVGVLVELEDE